MTRLFLDTSYVLALELANDQNPFQTEPQQAGHAPRAS